MSELKQFNNSEIPVFFDSPCTISTLQVLGLLRMSPDYLAMAATSAAIIRQPVDHLAAPGHGQVERHPEYL